MCERQRLTCQKIWDFLPSPNCCLIQTHCHSKHWLLCNYSDLVRYSDVVSHGVWQRGGKLLKEAFEVALHGSSSFCQSVRGGCEWIRVAGGYCCWVNDSCLCGCYLQWFCECWGYVEPNYRHHMAEVSALCKVWRGPKAISKKHLIDFILFQKQMNLDFRSSQPRDCSTIYNACPLLLPYCSIAYIWRQDGSHSVMILFTLCVLQLEKHSMRVQGQTGPHSHTAVLNILQFSRGTMWTNFRFSHNGI